MNILFLESCSLPLLFKLILQILFSSLERGNYATKSPEVIGKTTYVKTIKHSTHATAYSCIFQFLSTYNIKPNFTQLSMTRKQKNTVQTLLQAFFALFPLICQSWKSFTLSSFHKIRLPHNLAWGYIYKCCLGEWKGNELHISTMRLIWEQGRIGKESTGTMNSLKKANCAI